MRNSLVCVCFLFFFPAFVGLAQERGFQYQRPINNVEGQWHEVVLPEDIYNKTNTGLSDLRIRAIRTGQDKDTLEVPYILKARHDRISEAEVSFELINTSFNQRGSYYTFHLGEDKPINSIDLNIAAGNFNWRVVLEGSHDQKEWFTVLKDYRIVAIKNGYADYRFTRLVFPQARYPYFRVLLVKVKDAPRIEAVLKQRQTSQGEYRTCQISSFKVHEDQDNKQTVLDINLTRLVPLSSLGIRISDTVDYYRPVTISYLADSLKTEQGWRYRYNTLTTGIVNSFEDNIFRFTDQRVRTLQVVIENHDNEPLAIEKVEAKGVIHSLIGRFPVADYYELLYGKSDVAPPQYDLVQFQTNIPAGVGEVSLGDEVALYDEDKAMVGPLFENKVWLWVIMGAIIIVLGVFTGRMMGAKMTDMQEKA